MAIKNALTTATLLVLFVPTLLFAQVTVDERLAPGQPPLIIAHRTAILGGAPENSLAAIEYALKRGIEAIHINPQLTADKQYVLMHDPTLNRTTNVENVFPDGPPGGPTRASRGGKDYVRDYSLEQIQQLRLLNATDGGNHRVPTLEDALGLANGKLLLLLGVKSYEVESLAAVLNRNKKENLLLFELYYSGTDQTKLRDVTSATGIGAVVVLFQSRNFLSDFEKVFAQVGPAIKMVSARTSGLTSEFILRLDQLGIALLIGHGGPEDSALANKNDPAPWRELLDRGISASTNQPDKLLKNLGR